MYNMGASLLGAAILSGWFKGKPKGQPLRHFRGPNANIELLRNLASKRRVQQKHVLSDVGSYLA